MFSQVAVVSRDKVSVTANQDKLKVVDETATIKRHACKECGVHMFGRIENKNHPFFGLDFIHTELSRDSGWAPPNLRHSFRPSSSQGSTRPGRVLSERG